MVHNWILSDKYPAEFGEALRQYPPVILQLLWNRGLKTEEQIRAFFEVSWEKEFHDPFLFKDMEKAVALIFESVEKKEKITIFADYDADGIPGAVILGDTLKAVGAIFDVYIPHRELEGYGMNLKAVHALASQGTKMIITCDLGISNFAEVELAKSLGLKVILTDHHTVPEKLPPADAIIHPRVPGEAYPFKDLSGGGVTYKLAAALITRSSWTDVILKNWSGALAVSREGFLKWRADLAAISTIADMMPMLGENRVIAKFGLGVLGKTKRLGLQKMIKAARLTGQPMNSESISFRIAPRINAAGRMDHANAAVALLVSKDDAEAEKLAADLESANTERQRLAEKVFLEAKDQIVKAAEEKNPVLVVLGKDWPLSMVGLVAGKMAEEFYRPTFVFTVKEGGEVAGSARSIHGWNVMHAFNRLTNYLAKFGGHEMAGGCSLKDPAQFAEFKTKLTELAKEDFARLFPPLDVRGGGEGLSKMSPPYEGGAGGGNPIPPLSIDTEINLDDVNLDFISQIEKFAPFGEANPEPVFVSRGLTVKSVDPVGKDGKHLRLGVAHNSRLIHKTIGFCLGDETKHGVNWCKKLYVGDKIDMAFEVKRNEWNGRIEPEIRIVEIKMSAQLSSPYQGEAGRG